MMKFLCLYVSLTMLLLSCTGTRNSTVQTNNQTNPDSVITINGQSLRIQAYVWVDLMPGTGKDNTHRPLHASVTPLTSLSIGQEMIGEMWFVNSENMFEVAKPGWNGKEIYTAAGPTWSWDQPVYLICSFTGSDGKTMYVRSAEVNVEKVY